MVVVGMLSVSCCYRLLKPKGLREPSRALNRLRFPLSLCISSRFSRSRMEYYSTDIKPSSLYWNREECRSKELSSSIEGPITKAGHIFAIADPEDKFNENLYSGSLPEGCQLLKVGTCLTDFQSSVAESPLLQPNIIFISHPNARDTLIELLEAYPTIEWVQTRSAGVDHLLSISDGTLSYLPTNVQLTNAKGMYSSTLAEYALMTCSYFAKDLPRLLHQKSRLEWIQYPIQELRGSTMGIVGYGDIGRACAKLAKVYGMTVLGLKRTKSVELQSVDPYCDQFYYDSEGGLYEMLSRSDYILVSTPLTKQTRGLISKEALSKCQSTAVIINVGRGPIIDEEALIEALTSGAIKGAGLDVTTIEPLPKDSQLWNLDNVLLSPHNMDMTTTFMKESTDFFIQENLTRFVRGKMLLNPVDKFAGY